MPNTRPPLELFASTALGLESIAAGELKSLGVRGKQEIGGVAFAGDLDRLYRANLWLRSASRVLVRIGKFHASTFYELERRAKKVPWPEFLPAGGSVTVRATCRKSRLYHSDAVAERVLEAIARVAAPGIRMQQVPGGAGDDGEESSSDESAQIFVVRIVDDQVEISADSSGDLLHRRGYRQEVAKAPLRETLAAAMVLASGWRRHEKLLDPLCGSGTIPIEAALIARNIAPGIARDFQFTKWPSFDARRWESITAEAHAAATVGDAVGGSKVLGGDRDAGAIAAAARNAERAGVSGDIEFSVSSLSESLARIDDPANSAVWILANPPYGVRVGESTELRDLYSTFGNELRAHPAWRLGILAADQALAHQLRLTLRSRFDSRNGGIPVSFLVSEKTPSPATPFSESSVGRKETTRN